MIDQNTADQITTEILFVSKYIKQAIDNLNTLPGVMPTLPLKIAFDYHIIANTLFRAVDIEHLMASKIQEITNLFVEIVLDLNAVVTLTYNLKNSDLITPINEPGTSTTIKSWLEFALDSVNEKRVSLEVMWKETLTAVSINN